MVKLVEYWHITSLSTELFIKQGDRSLWLFWIWNAVYNSHDFVPILNPQTNLKEASRTLHDEHNIYSFLHLRNVYWASLLGQHSPGCGANVGDIPVPHGAYGLGWMIRIDRVIPQASVKLHACKRSKRAALRAYRGVYGVIWTGAEQSVTCSERGGKGQYVFPPGNITKSVQEILQKTERKPRGTWCEIKLER